MILSFRLFAWECHVACGEVASERVILSTSTSLKPNAKRKKNSKSKKLKQRILRDHESKKTMRKMKHLSSIANDVVQRCSQELETTIDDLVKEFECQWKPGSTGGTYSKKFVEFCNSKVTSRVCENILERIKDGSFTRLTFDMMLAWQQPDADDNESYKEAVGKESEDKRIQATLSPEQDDISLFYSDMMPLLVDHEPSVGEDAFVYLGSIIPLPVDIINGRYTFETLTAPTGHQLHFPAYDMFVKEIHKCMKHLQKQSTPKGIELADDEIILHVEGTMASQRVIRHIKETSWPGRLTLTNYALYFEAAGIINYEDAIKIDLSKDNEKSTKPMSTGPLGAPLFDKAIVYESPDFEEGIVIEFPEMTSSTRRDHWLMLVKEITLMHKFLRKFNVESPLQSWEIHSRTILGIIRLHAAREMLRISPPDPKNFLIFSLFEEVPKGDYVLEELAEISLKIGTTRNPCSASSILRNMNMDQLGDMIKEEGEDICKEKVVKVTDKEEMLASLESAVNQSREEGKVIEKARATTAELEEEGISESVAVLMELLRPLQDVLPWFQEVIYWERPSRTLFVLAITILTVYKEWVGKAIAACLIWVVAKMAQARNKMVHTKSEDAVTVSTESDQTVTESIVSAQYGLIRLHQLMQHVNVTILKLRSLYTSKASKHASMVMALMLVLASFFAVVPFKLFIIFGIVYCFVMTSSVGTYMSNDQSNRRMKEWWDSIPIVPVRVRNASSK
ncbi:ArgH (DUF639) [Arabidopsis thaliana]|uniref:ArgH (DUF639) n=2 Tax=Arabidopsis TaxID=3701 RepID=F4IHL4_ARATH|nr:ArgH (DUF639) [Arabidopsis thaliana]AEC07214.1 ArgH (DUF639) [Arabidopsis thaliana]|eukprot:NP_179764.4 ArgH (DUF639) [Arabidopsis thaliana]